MVDYIRETAVKKSCKYGKYGLFEQVLSCLLHARPWSSKKLFTDIVCEKPKWYVCCVQALVYSHTGHARIEEGPKRVSV